MIPYSALNLAERGDLPAELRPSASRIGVQDRIKWWRRRFHRNNHKVFSYWLALGGLEAPSDLTGVAERVGGLTAAAFPRAVPWTGVIESLDRTPTGAGAATDQHPLVGALPDPMVAPFLEFAGREIAAVVARLDPGGRVISREIAVEGASTYLRARLINIARSTTALALNMARLRGDLTGSTPEDRARDFFARLSEPAFRARILSDFPVLERRLAQATAATVDAVSRFLGHLIADFAELTVSFAFGEQPVDEIRFGLGDPHKLGQSVAVVSFGGPRLIYKPRSLGVDDAFAQLVGWFNHISSGDLQAPAVLDREDHGWSEFIAYRECVDASDVDCAYARTGALLALLHLCGASDLHFENLIYRDSHPIPVDLETVLTPSPRARARSKALGAARRVHRRSVLTVGYLPSPMATPEGRVDLSAAGLFEDQKSPFKSVVVGDMERDDVKAAARQGVLSPVGNVPRLNGQAQPAAQHVDQIVEGFTRAYEDIRTHKAELQAAGGPLEAFGDARIRWVARPTVQYATMQIQANHPSLMRDGLDLDMAWADLWSSLDSLPHLRRIIRSEYEDLWNGDIPYFTTTGGSRAVEDSAGRRIEDFFEQSGLEALEARVAGLSDADLRRQVNLIRLAFSASSLDGGAEQPEQPVAAFAGSGPSAAFCLAEAEEIGDRLLRSEWLEAGLPYWFGIRSIDQTGFRADLSGPDLYAGSAGVGVFMAELASATGAPRFLASAKRIERAMESAPPFKTIGAYEGAGGLLYAHLRVAECLGKSNPAFVRRQLSRIARLAPTDQGLDMISGAAGGLICALRAAETSATHDQAIATALLCGERLLETAIEDEEAGTAAWMNSVFKAPLTGFSHGATGMALALAQLAHYTGDDRFASAAWRALRFEAGHLDGGPHAWRDARPGTKPGAGWCHGPPGMTLGRFEIAKLGLSGAPASLVDEIHLGLEAISRTGGGGSHCLCHGALGNLEPLMEGGETTRPLAQALLASALREKQADNGWLCGYGRGVETPGLMTGLSGIGLMLLRVADPSVPSALTLQTRAWTSRLSQ